MKTKRSQKQKTTSSASSVGTKKMSSSVDEQSLATSRSGISSSAYTNDTGSTGQKSIRRRRRLRRVIKALSFQKGDKKSHASSNGNGNGSSTASTQPKEVVIMAGGDSVSVQQQSSLDDSTTNSDVRGLDFASTTTTSKTTASLPPIDERAVTAGVTVATLDREDADEDDVLFFDALQVGDDAQDEDNLAAEKPDQPVILLDNVIAIGPGGAIHYEDGDSRPEPQPAKNHKKDKEKENLLALSPPPVPSVPLPKGDPNFVPATLSPPPPVFLPLRFLRAGKGDVGEGKRRYKATLDWRKANQIDNILREPSPHFATIKKYYPHFCHGRGYHGEPCYYEQPPKTKLKMMQNEGASIDKILRHYAMATEFQWQYLVRDDLRRSIYIIDLQGMRFSDFVGDVVDFVKRASGLSSQHYPERAGAVYVINVPAWFKMIWNVVKPWVDEATLKKISILRDKAEIRRAMEERIPLHNIPQEYGGKSPYPLGKSPEEVEFAALVEHNNRLARGDTSCGGAGGDCRFCKWTPARSY